MNALETNYRYLPLPYRIALECTDQMGYDKRNLADLRQWCDAYAATYAIDLQSDEHKHFVQSACAIASKRWPDIPTHN